VSTLNYNIENPLNYPQNSAIILNSQFSYFRQVLPSVEPGYLQDLLPNEVSEKAENWNEIMEDLNRAIMPGITHWQSPNFHAYFPTQTSYPAIVGDIFSAGLGVLGTTWVSTRNF
jgi:aromatic-L-amino-acid/L-tryptophan decarboxylase